MREACLDRDRVAHDGAGCPAVYGSRASGRAGDGDRNRAGLLGSGAPGRDGGSVEPCAHRTCALGGDRLDGPLPLTNLPPELHAHRSAAGFNTVRREGLELSGSFTATVNLSLQVGNLEETLTVTGEAPVVDVSSAQRQQVVNSEVMAAIPASRS